LRGGQVWPEVFGNISSYDIIYYVGHGAINPRTGLIAIGTGEPFSEARANDYNNMLKGMGLSLVSDQYGNQYIRRFKTTLTQATFGITSHFVVALSKNLRATAVYIDSCHTIESYSMANAFLYNGARSYFGWDDGVYSFNIDQYPKSLIDDLFAGNDVQTAYGRMSFNFTNGATLRYVGDGSAKLPNVMAAPGTITVSPASGAWTSVPQNLTVTSTNATVIYYTMVNTYDGSIPPDPRVPTNSDYDGYFNVSGGAGTFQLDATVGQNKRSKLRFCGYNSAGTGTASGVFSYSINLSLPGSISLNPGIGSWTSSPQNLSVSSTGATAIYYTMVNTYDGTVPADPREPTSSDNDGYVTVSGGAGTFQLYANAGQYKRTKLRFRGYSGAGAGPGSGVYSYSINLGPLPGGISVTPSTGTWTSSPQNLSASSSNATVIYYTMVNTYDGSIPTDPREPTSSDNDGYVTVSGGAGTFQLYANAGEYKRSKLRFRGYNGVGAGPASGIYAYSIDLRVGAVFSGQINAYTAYGFFIDNTLAYSGGNNTPNTDTFTLNVAPGKYKVIFLNNLGNTQEQAYAMYDQYGNNEFTLSNGAVVSFGASTLNSANGRFIVNVTGTWYSGTIYPLQDINGAWDTNETITYSDNPQYSVGQIVTSVNTITQTGNRIDRYNSTTGTTFTGCINGNLIYVEKIFYTNGWTNNYFELMSVDATGNYMAGKSQQNSTYPPATNSLIKMDVERTKRQ
jgi:hypothetical protein